MAGQVHEPAPSVDGTTVDVIEGLNAKHLTFVPVVIVPVYSSVQSAVSDSIVLESGTFTPELQVETGRYEPSKMEPCGSFLTGTSALGEQGDVDTLVPHWHDDVQDDVDTKIDVCMHVRMIA